MARKPKTEDDGTLSKMFAVKREVMDAETGRNVKVSHTVLLDLSGSLPPPERMEAAMQAMEDNSDYNSKQVVIVKTLCLCGEPVMGAAWVEMVECGMCGSQCNFPALIEMRLEELHEAEHAS